MKFYHTLIRSDGFPFNKILYSFLVFIYNNWWEHAHQNNKLWSIISSLERLLKKISLIRNLLLGINPWSGWISLSNGKQDTRKQLPWIRNLCYCQKVMKKWKSKSFSCAASVLQTLKSLYFFIFILAYIWKVRLHTWKINKHTKNWIKILSINWALLHNVQTFRRM